MSLATDVENLATAVATAVKADRTKINGNQPDLSALATTVKTDLVSAINEVAGSVGGAAGIDDGTVSTTSTWSSSKTSTELDGKADTGHGHVVGDVTGLQAELDGKASTTHGHAIADVSGLQTALNGKSDTGHAHAIADTTGLQAALDGKAGAVHTHAITDTTGLQTALDGKAATGHTHTTAQVTGLDAALAGKAATGHTHGVADVDGFDAAVDARISSTLDLENAPELLNSINELASAIGDDANFAATTAASLANRVRVDAAQALTAPQQAQARSNIGAVAAADVGGPTDFAAVFAAALA
jgi:hypothetical protein